MKNKISGKRSGSNPSYELELLVDGKMIDLDVSLAVVNHSPTGFNAGYGGSGVAQSALAILLIVVGKEKALKTYQSFKWQFLAKPEYLNKSFEFELDIAQWVTFEIQKQNTEMEMRKGL